jgi:LysM repeat protein
MVERDLIDALNDCIDRLATGQSVEDCLRVYPRFQAQLRPMLQAGLVTRRAEASAVEVSGVQGRVRARFEEQLARPQVRPRPPLVFPVLRQLAAFAAAFALLFGVLSVGAESALPGDPLYGLKRFTEDVRIGLGGDAAAFSARRIEEIQLLLAAGRAAEVEFRGIVGQITGNAWLVNTLIVRVEAGTEGAAAVQMGDDIIVTGETTTAGELVAIRVRFADGIQRQPLTPTPTLTSTPSATPTVAPSPTAMATLTAAVCVPAVPPGWVIYSVQPGDTLSSLAASAGVALSEVLLANCIVDAGAIIVGQRIALPALPAAPLQGNSGGNPVGDPGGGNSGSSGGSGSGSGDDGDDGDDDDDDDGDDD